MSNFTQITGSNSGGLAVLDQLGVLSNIETTPGAFWRPSTITAATPKGISGNNANGVVAYSDKDVRYLTSLGNPQAKWKTAPPAPFTILGMVGDPVNGITIYGLDDSKDYTPAGSQMAQINLSEENPTWKWKTKPPFTVDGIAGDNKTGVVIIGIPVPASVASAPVVSNDGGSNNQAPVPERVATSMARSGPDCNCDWKSLPTIQIVIEKICGDCTNGVVFFGEGQLLSYDLAKPAIKLQAPIFSIRGMTGNPKDGLAVIAGAGDFVVTCGDTSKPITWSVSNGPMVPK